MQAWSRRFVVPAVYTQAIICPTEYDRSNPPENAEEQISSSFYVRCVGIETPQEPEKGQ